MRDLTLSRRQTASTMKQPMDEFRMTAKASGLDLAAYLAAGWTEAQLLEHGYIEPVPATWQAGAGISGCKLAFEYK